MATTPEDELDERTHTGDAAREFISRARTKVAVSQNKSVLPVLLLMLLGAAVTLLPDTIGGLAAAAVVWLTYWLARVT